MQLNQVALAAVCVIGPCWMQEEVAYHPTTTSNLNALRSMLEEFRAAHERDVRSEVEFEHWLRELGMRGIPLDPWGRPYRFTLDAANVPRLYTLGADGVSGGTDSNIDSFSSPLPELDVDDARH